MTVKQACANCHFFIRNYRNDRGAEHTFAIEMEQREKAMHGDLSWQRDSESIACYKGIWDEGLGMNNSEKIAAISNHERHNKCYFFNYQRGMLLQAAEKLQQIESDAASEARKYLLLKDANPLSVSVPQGAVFDYFDKLRKILEQAKKEIFFVDPYIDAEFVSRYLPHIAPGVVVRLLGRNSMSTLLPAVHLFRQQSGANIEVRSSSSLHDRFVFVDKSMCFQSGASFKDGAKKSSTTLTQITDAFVVVQSTHETLWSSGTHHP